MKELKLNHLVISDRVGSPRWSLAYRSWWHAALPRYPNHGQPHLWPPGCRTFKTRNYELMTTTKYWLPIPIEYILILYLCRFAVAFMRCLPSLKEFMAHSRCSWTWNTESRLGLEYGRCLNPSKQIHFSKQKQWTDTTCVILWFNIPLSATTWISDSGCNRCSWLFPPMDRANAIAVVVQGPWAVEQLSGMAARNEQVSLRISFTIGMCFFCALSALSILMVRSCPGFDQNISTDVVPWKHFISDLILILHVALLCIAFFFNQFLSVRFWLGQHIHRLLLIYKDLKGSSLGLKAES